MSSLIFPELKRALFSLEKNNKTTKILRMLSAQFCLAFKGYTVPFHYPLYAGEGQVGSSSVQGWTVAGLIFFYTVSDPPQDGLWQNYEMAKTQREDVK